MRLPVFFSAAVLACTSSCARAVNVGTCEEFEAVDRKTETEVTITNSEFTCDEYTRLSIRTDMVLKSSVGAVTFSNLALKVYGSLTVEPDVVFTGISFVEKNGGALKLELGAVSVFQGTAGFHNCSVITTEYLESVVDSRYSYGYIQRKGAAVHNKGSLTFEKDAEFSGNYNDRVEFGSGPGGAISNHVKGTMTFKGDLTMTGNTADDYFGGAEGGAFYNRGDVVVEGDTYIVNNKGGQGGAIYQEEWGTFVINGFADISKNTCYDTYGGAIANFGGTFEFNGGSSFIDNFAENSGDGGNGGAIYNGAGGMVTLTGTTSFIHNYGYRGGAIYNILDQDDDNYEAPVITFPTDTVFSENYGEYCNDIAYSRDEDCGL